MDALPTESGHTENGAAVRRPAEQPAPPALENVSEVSLGKVRIAVVEGAAPEGAGDDLRVSQHRTRAGETYLRVSCPLSDPLAVPELLRQLADQGALPSDRTAELLARGITGLVAQACADYMDRDPDSPRPARSSGLARRAMLQRIKHFARSRLADPELKPEMLAQHHHISLRYLQKLFQDHGQSPASWIRDERLHRCCTELRDPRLAHLTIAMIGERSGLYGASHFSRLFRDRYGISPREYRRDHARLTDAA
ncbi:AraC-like DNA-binding protein [Streptomyces sp. TLI_235]|nr:helix-turn-helix domain-containing protein [Streptomyces sp. TLI_235]PBC78704.1 AraC-like DNA-binding protein [Streptomyces sp. TLI_235]